MTMKSCVLKLPEELHRPIKTTASAQGRTINELLLDILWKRLAGNLASPAKSHE